MERNRRSSGASLKYYSEENENSENLGICMFYIRFNTSHMPADRRIAGNNTRVRVATTFVALTALTISVLFSLQRQQSLK